jgi:ABC-type transporter Mla MlaB component
VGKAMKERRPARQILVADLTDGAVPAGADFRIWGPIRRDDLPGLTERVCGVLTAASGSALVGDVAGVRADAVCVEALARLQLAAKRKGCRITLRNAAADLMELVAFLGLADVLVEDTASAVESSPVQPGR